MKTILHYEDTLDHPCGNIEYVSMGPKIVHEFLDEIGAKHISGDDLNFFEGKLRIESCYEIRLGEKTVTITYEYKKGLASIGNESKMFENARTALDADEKTTKNLEGRIKEFKKQHQII